MTPNDIAPVFVPLDYPCGNAFRMTTGGTRRGNKMRLAETAQWCRDQFGEGGTRWHLFSEGYTFIFHRPEDAFAFKMRWM